LKALVVIIICVGLLLPGISPDPDLFARLSVGKLISTLGQVPTIDPFAFSPKKAIWIDHEWLSGLVFYNIQALFSDFGLLILELSVCALTVFILVEASKLYKPINTFSSLIFTLLLVIDSRYIWESTVRSQIFTYLFLSIYLYIFVACVKRGNILLQALLPLLMIIWCNMHGGFVVGLGLHLIFVLLYRHKGFPLRVLFFTISVLVTAVNPYGFFEYWNYILTAVSMTRPSISEWQPIGLNLQLLIPLAVFFCGSYVLIKKKHEHFVYVFFLLSALFAFIHQRHLAIFYFICLVFLQDSFEFPSLGNMEFMKKVKVSTVIVMTGFSVYFCTNIISLLLHYKSFSFSYRNYPEEALAWLAANKEKGKLLIDFNNGSYAIWKLFPEFTVSLDGRYEEVYPDATLELVNAAYSCDPTLRAKALSSLKPDFALIAGKSVCYEGFNTIYQDERYRLIQF
jgi:hypothetical protein